MCVACVARRRKKVLTYTCNDLLLYNTNDQALYVKTIQAVQPTVAICVVCVMKALYYWQLLLKAQANSIIDPDNDQWRK